MKLINMSDFVLEQEKIVDNSGDYRIFKKAFNFCEKYAKFIKQPLELWMVVPCDEDGNVLEEPILNPICCRKPNDDGIVCPECCGSPDPDYDTIEWSLYFKAKERCLFEGFEYFGHDSTVVYKGIAFDIENMNIEDLMIFAEIYPELTQTAIKQLGL